jgi:hypothetical protein
MYVDKSKLAHFLSMSELFEGLIKRQRCCEEELAQCKLSIGRLSLLVQDIRLREMASCVKRLLNLQDPHVRVQFPGAHRWVIDIGEPVHTTLTSYVKDTVICVTAGKDTSFSISDCGQIELMQHFPSCENLTDFAQYVTTHREFFQAVISLQDTFCTLYWRFCTEIPDGYWITKLNYMYVMFFGRPKLLKDVRKRIWFHYIKCMN